MHRLPSSQKNRLTTVTPTEKTTVFFSMDKIGIASTTYLYCAVNHCVGKNIGGHLITSASDLKDETNNQIKGNKINTAIKTVTAVPTISFTFIFFISFFCPPV